MKTLGRLKTKPFFLNENGFQEVRARWAELANSTDLSKRPSAVDNLLYLAILGKDIRKGFGETTNTVKLENGQRADQGLRQALRTVRTACLYKAIHRRLERLFPGLLNVEEVTRMLDCLPSLKEPNLLKVEPYTLMQTADEALSHAIQLKTQEVEMVLRDQGEVA